MGRLTGAFYFDSQPVPAGQASGLRAECEADPRDWPSGNGRFVSGGGDVCTWDGRIDNRKDLLLQLGQDLPEGPSDAALALKLYQTNGIDGFRNLVGDWSLALWNARSRTVVLASDYAGIRLLYYHHTLRGLTWSISASRTPATASWLLQWRRTCLQRRWPWWRWTLRWRRSRRRTWWTPVIKPHYQRAIHAADSKCCRPFLFVARVSPPASSKWFANHP